MSMIKNFISATIIFLLLDMVWLGLVAKKLYLTQYGTLLRRSGDKIIPLWPAAIIVYLLLVLGVLFFVLPKANGNSLLALAWGAAFGFIVYGVYDFTNLSIINNWPLAITFVDVLWGTALCGVTSALVTFIQKI